MPAPSAATKRPRPRHADRNLQIFKKVAIQRLSHEDAARVFGLHRSRVTQIVKQVAQSLAAAEPADPNAPLAEKLDPALEKLRLEYLLETTARALREGPGRAAETSHEPSIEGETGNIQLFKTYLRAVCQLSTLNRSRRARPVPPSASTPLDLFEAVQLAISRWLTALGQQDASLAADVLSLIDDFYHRLSARFLADSSPPTTTIPNQC